MILAIVTMLHVSRRVHSGSVELKNTQTCLSDFRVSAQSHCLLLFSGAGTIRWLRSVSNGSIAGDFDDEKLDTASRKEIARDHSHEIQGLIKLPDRT